jgi:hypothetical protein
VRITGRGCRPGICTRSWSRRRRCGDQGRQPRAERAVCGIVDVGLTRSSSSAEKNEGGQTDHRHRRWGSLPFSAKDKGLTLVEYTFPLAGVRRQLLRPLPVQLQSATC